ncbi:MAG: chromate transporter [Burkholderiales bacterium]|nr:chromate transporter [Burkholderiales bacterium]
MALGGGVPLSSWTALWLGPGPLSAGQWLALFTHFTVLSLLAVGGAITTVPSMHRFLVSQQGWLSDAQFTASVAIAQAAPGPNVLFVAVMGYNVGGLAGVAATLLGTLAPSTALTLLVTRWGSRRSQASGVRAFTAGLAPLTIGLMLATSWILLEPTRAHPIAPLLVAGTLWVMLRTRLSPLWALAAGALVGVLGWV